MSGPNNIIPQPPRQGPMRAGETDFRSFSFNGDLAQDNDTITNAALVTIGISRIDAATITANDLATVGFVAMDSTATIVQSEFNAPAAAANVDYCITVAIKTVQGRTLIRDAYMLVANPLG